MCCTSLWKRFESWMTDCCIATQISTTPLKTLSARSTSFCGTSLISTIYALLRIMLVLSCGGFLRLFVGKLDLVEEVVRDAAQGRVWPLHEPVDRAAVHL